jgi:hypothetical protein
MPLSGLAPLLGTHCEELLSAGPAHFITDLVTTHAARFAGGATIIVVKHNYEDTLPALACAKKFVVVRGAFPLSLLAGHRQKFVNLEG